jgi:hypothetical protein
MKNMDVEKLRKINMLSHELKKHGMAESSTDAYTQAQQMVQVIPKQSVAPQESVVIEAAPAADPLASRQFQMEIEKMQKSFSDELDVMRTAINQIISEVNALREDLSKAQVAAPPKQKEKQVELKTEVKVSHPRQGDWKPGDVDIQKMFYYGNGAKK